MENLDFETLTHAMNYWNEKGYRESFKAKEDVVFASFSKKNIEPEKVKIVDTHRFDGMTNPSDDVELIVAKSDNGIKGTFLLSHSSRHNQNEDVIRKLEKAE